MAVTSQPQVNGHQQANQATNGHSNGHTNGSNGHVNGSNGATNGHSTNGHNGTNGNANGHSSPATPDEDPSTPYYEPIAITGCAMRLPGGVETAESLWDLLENKREGRCKVPADRYNVEAFYGPGQAGHVNTEYGHFLQQVDMAEVDSSHWSMTRQEIEDMDPQQRLALEVVYECFQNSGTTKWKGKNIGTYFGTFGEDWADMSATDTQQTGVYKLPGTGDFIVANRVSYEFGLQGPSIIIRTACSSSLTALHEACLGIQRGECDSAIVGGTNLILNPRMTIAMSEQGVLAPDGRCKSFDASANGYARAEGVVALHIKKLSAALRDNDPIRAVIRGSCINSDGRTSGMTQPSSTAHHTLILRSHKLARVDLATTAMIECHGTGTAIGDPLETAAVARAFGQHGVYIGSLKPNLGHSEGASGVSSTIKAMLALEHRQIPPNINFKEGHPNIPFKENKLIVPTEMTPWPAGKAERIGINSFGIGGANAHILLESAAQNGVARSGEPTPISDSHYLLTFSASHPDSLRRMVQQNEAYLHKNPGRLADLSYTLNLRREPLPHRAYSVVNAKEVDQPLSISTFGRAGGVPSVAFVFTGQGAQWPGMGADLLDTNPIFSQSIDLMDETLQKCSLPPSWTLREELKKTAKEGSRIMSTEWSQPCCTAIQVALVDVLRSWGIRPVGVVGHSSGEVAAAYASGALSKQSAILAAYFRGLVTKEVKTHGAMAAVGLGRSAVTPLLKPGVVVACENSPSSVTLSGDADKVGEVLEDVKAAFPDAAVRALRVDCAYHSHHMKAVEERYLDLLPHLGAEKPTVRYFSSVKGAPFDGDMNGPYWAMNLVEPVLFSPAVSAMLKSVPASTVLLEVGPHSALAGPIRQILQAAGSTKVEYAHTLTRGAPGSQSLLTSAGRLFQLGAEVDMASFVRTGQTLTDLPLYPWRREGPFWGENRLSNHWRLRKFPTHDLLGDRITSASDAGPAWRNMLRLNQVPWLRDHRVAGDIVFPAAGYVAMAGEAVRQLVDVDEQSFSLREVHISSALVLQEGVISELITHVRPVKLTNSLDSQWHEFDISSLQGDRWVRHAYGQVRSGVEYSSTAPAIEAQQRQVEPAHWYKVMERFGLAYGPHFQGLRHLSAGVLEHKAVATIASPPPTLHRTTYPMHPTAIDFALQLYSVAQSRGQARRFNQLAVPSYIGSAFVRPVGTKDIRLQVAAETTPRGAVVGDATGVCDGEVVFHLNTLRMSPLADADDARGDDPHAATEMVWKPDIRLVDHKPLLRTAKQLPTAEEVSIVERMALACAIEASELLSDSSTTASSKPHLVKYRDWLRNVHAQAIAGTYPKVPDSADIAALSSQARRTLIENLFKQASATSAQPAAAAVHRVLQAIEETLAESNGVLLNVGLDEEFLQNTRDFVRSIDATDFYKLASHYKPDLRVLEIGGGAGTGAKAVLDVLTTVKPHKGRHYGSYTLTNPSNELLEQAKERLTGYEAVECKVLDISEDVVEQGFEAGSFDLIIASNALHATSSIAASLTNVRKLLSPTGHVLIQELDPSSKWINFVLGTSTTWWLGEKDNRTTEPYLSSEQWQRLLAGSGLDDITAVHRDEQLSATIIARPKGASVLKKITLLSPPKETSQVQAVTSMLKNKGYSIDHRQWGQDIVPGQDVLALMDLDTPYLKDLSSEEYSQFQSFVRGLNGSGVLWVTGAAQVNCVDPAYGLIVGLARTMRTEQSVDFATLELESFDASGWDAIGAVLPEFQARLAPDDETDPIMEWSLAGGLINISRFHWTPLNQELAVSEDAAFVRRLDVGKRGFLNTLYWREHAPGKPQGNNLRIRTHASGLNFKDVLIAMGIVGGIVNEGDGLGLEAAGVVEEIGPDVKNFKVGDRCIAFASGALASHLTTTEELCVKIPDSLSYAEAATMPTVYCTAMYSLADKAGVEPGQSVLIHSAGGGVGIAAIQVCRHLGAEIFCTVGSEDKIQYLIQTFGIPRERIFHSRDLTFRRDILKATNGRGVDVVLNSLSGELLHGSWDCVAEYGTMIEIGKRDLIGKGALQLHPFEQNRSYIGIDFGRICAQRPALITKLLQRIIDLYSSGAFKPIMPMTSFDAVKIEDSMRFMQKGSHIGKVVINIPDNLETLSSRAPKQEALFPDNAAYLLAGGLGGLGQAVAVWMAESGATEIIFLSRSASDEERYGGFVQELKSLGCNAILVPGSVTSLQDVEKAVSSATKPIKGVMQATMVLKDAGFLDMPFEDWQAALVPKVQGTWNLHNALLKQKLDFFLLFSSWSGIVGYTGQANYASANAFLDAFAQYRRSQNLTAAVVDMSAVEDIGYVSRTSHVMDHFRATSTYALKEQDVLDSLHALINRSIRPAVSQSTTAGASQPGQYSFISKGQLAIGLKTTQALSSPSNRVVWKRDPRMSLYKNMDAHDATVATGGNEVLKQFLAEVAQDRSVLNGEAASRLLATEFGTAVFGFLMRDIELLDLDDSLEALGVDSLVSIELRNWFRQRLGLELTSIEILGSPSLLALGQLAAERLKAKFAAADEGAGRKEEDTMRYLVAKAP